MKQYSHKIMLFSIALFFCVAIQAQVSNSTKHSFRSYNSLQALMGSSTNSVAMHSVNGFQFHSRFVGIGVGFDCYYQTSVPLFLELRQNVFGKEKKVQAFVNAGIHLPASNKNRQEPFKTGNFSAGRLLALGFDYYIPVKKYALVMGVAYSQKKLTQMVENNVWNPVINRVDNVPIKEQYQFNRVWMKIGWVF